MKRTGSLPTIRLTSAIIKVLDELNLIKLACERQSGRICLYTIPDAGLPSQIEFMHLLARHANQRDLLEVSLPVDLNEYVANLSFLEQFTNSFEEQSLDKLTLRLVTSQHHHQLSKETNAMSRYRTHGLPWLSQSLKLLTKVPRKELYLSIEWNGSAVAERECEDFFRLLSRHCSDRISPDCYVRVSIRGSNSLTRFPVSFYESVAACHHVITDIRLQEMSACKVVSLETLLMSTMLCDSRTREITAFRVKIPDEDSETFCSALAETLWNPSTSLECLDLYQTSLKKVVLSGQLGRSLESAKRQFASPFQTKCLKRLRFDATGCSDDFWAVFCSSVLPHLNVQSLSVYYMKWNTNVCNSFISGLRKNQYLGELDLVYLTGSREQYFRYDHRRIRRYLGEKRGVRDVWGTVSKCYSEGDQLHHMLKDIASEPDQPSSRAPLSTNFLHRIARYCLAPFKRSDRNTHRSSPDTRPQLVVDDCTSWCSDESDKR